MAGIVLPLPNDPELARLEREQRRRSQLAVIVPQQIDALVGGVQPIGKGASTVNLHSNLADASPDDVDWHDGRYLNLSGLFGDQDKIQFNLARVGTLAEGEVGWDSVNGTLAIGMPGGVVELQLGQEQHIKAKNVSGGTITDGMGVYISDSTGAFPEIGKADATDHRVAMSTLAVATEDIADNQFGFITTFGVVRNVDTSWATADGTPAFLSTTPGVLSSSLPTQPDSQVFVAVVIKKHATEGILFVKVIGQPNLDELSDVLISGVADGELIVWDNASSTWQNKTRQVSVTQSLDAYINVATKRQDVNLHGGLVKIGDAQALSVFPPLNLTTGLGKLVFVVNAGIDLVGDITITGISVDRDTGSQTIADTEVISINGATTDNSGTDTGGNVTHDWANAYISTKWWINGVVLSTADVNISDLDVWHCSFEQFNDQSNITVQTLDIYAFELNTAAELYAHLYYVNPGAGSTLALSSIANIEYQASSGAANRYVRLRRSDGAGSLPQAIDGAREGIFLDVFFERFANADWEDITLRIWYDCLKDLQ